MNYKRIYNDLIARAQTRKTVDGYKERHHIVPVSLGGSNEKSNLVELTAREHFIAHVCLALIHGGTQWYAVVRMRKQHELKDYKVNSRLYEIAKIKRSEEHRKGGWKHTEEERRAKSVRQTGGSHSGGKAISAAKKGKPLSEKNRLALKGPRKPWSEARRAAYEKWNFSNECRKLNILIDSVFQPEAVVVSA